MARFACWGLALVFAVTLSASIFRIPIQSTDSLEMILQARRSPSVSATFASTLGAFGFMRPMFYAQNKVMFDLAGESSLHMVFRGFHAVLLSAAILLFVACARVQTASDFGACAIALTVLLGLHSFRGAVGEAYPVNHYLNVSVVCLLVLALARSTPRLWTGVVATLAFVYGLLILETGALGWVIAVTAWLVGWRGISGRTIVVMTGVLLYYLVVRFVQNSVGVPALTERTTGFLLGVLEPPELVSRFGAWPFPFYLYNVVTSFMSVLFSEPRAGRFVSVAAWLQGELGLRLILMLVTSLATTVAIGFAIASAWRSRALDDSVRFIAVFAAVLAANAAISFPYTKDEIMLPAGIFYALATYGALRLLWQRVPASGTWRRASLTAAVLLISTGWAVRAAGVPYYLRSQAFKQRTDWALLAYTSADTIHSLQNAGERRLLERMRADALNTPIPNPHFERTWERLIWED